jgi:hypothetical protein
VRRPDGAPAHEGTERVGLVASSSTGPSRLAGELDAAVVPRHHAQGPSGRVPKIEGGPDARQPDDRVDPFGARHQGLLTRATDVLDGTAIDPRQAQAHVAAGASAHGR